MYVKLVTYWQQQSAPCKLQTIMDYNNRNYNNNYSYLKATQQRFYMRLTTKVLFTTLLYSIAWFLLLFLPTLCNAAMFLIKKFFYYA